VIADSFRTDDQLFGDVCVSLSLSNETKHLSFAISQLGKNIRNPGRMHGAKEFHHPGGNSRAEDRLSDTDFDAYAGIIPPAGTVVTNSLVISTGTAANSQAQLYRMFAGGSGCGWKG